MFWAASADETNVDDVPLFRVPFVKLQLALVTLENIDYALLFLNVVVLGIKYHPVDNNMRSLVTVLVFVIFKLVKVIGFQFYFVLPDLFN